MTGNDAWVLDMESLGVVRGWTEVTVVKIAVGRRRVDLWCFKGRCCVDIVVVG